MTNRKFILIALLAVFFAACNSISTPKDETPTDVLKKFIEASQKKDANAIKQTLSAGTLQMLQTTAEKRSTTIDDLLTRDSADAFKEMPETRNEMIEGDTAFVEVKNKATNDWDKIPFVKEENKWKIALDKFMKDLMDKMSEQMKPANITPPPAPNAERNSNSSSNSAANK